MIYRISYEKSNIQFWFFKKIPNIEIKGESSILKIYKKSATNITLTAENLYAFPLRSAIRKECLVSSRPFHVPVGHLACECHQWLWDMEM